MFLYQDLIRIFDDCFFEAFNTRLVKGGEEPIYLPANQDCSFHAIHFAHGFFSSALHEIAHWLIAGESRRLLVDFGYWYAPDGRTPAQQKLFEQCEVKPQALEWILSQATGYPFRISLDNLNNQPVNPEPFKQAIFQQVEHYCTLGLPTRAIRLRHALCQFYQTEHQLDFRQFSLCHL